MLIIVLGGDTGLLYKMLKNGFNTIDLILFIIGAFYAICLIIKNSKLKEEINKILKEIKEKE